MRFFPVQPLFLPIHQNHHVAFLLLMMLARPGAADQSRRPSRHGVQ